MVHSTQTFHIHGAVRNELRSSLQIVYFCVVSSSEFNCQSYSQRWWHNVTGTGTEYASFIFTITLQQIYPAFSASKIIIKYSAHFARVQSPPPLYICSSNIWNVCKKVCQCAVSPARPDVAVAGDWQEEAPRKKWLRPHETRGLAGPSEASDLHTHKEWY